MVEVKAKVIEAIQNLPYNATYGDIMEVVFLQQKIAKGITQADSGKAISREEF